MYFIKFLPVAELISIDLSINSCANSDVLKIALYKSDLDYFSKNLAMPHRMLGSSSL